jgi:hypothetical protein
MEPEPYIPLRVSDLVEVLVSEAGTPEWPPLPAAQHAPLKELSRVLLDCIERNYRALEHTVRDAYAVLDPDSETTNLREHDADQHARGHRFFECMNVLLTRGGFYRMTREEIEATMQGASDWGIEMDVCWDVFDRVEVYYRGKGIGWRVRRPWWRLFRPQDVELPTYRRVVMIFKQAPHKRLGTLADTRHIFLKLFKNIPIMDIEMLLPGTRLRMPKLERGKLGGSALGSVVYLIYQLVLKSSFAAILSGSLFALATPLLMIGGYGYKTLYSYRVSQRNYMLQLTQSLYYQSLDSNAGVLYRLFHEAAEQDLRQTLLAYYFLWRFAADGWTLEELDRAIEHDLAKRIGHAIEVDTAEAVKRLERFDMIRRDGQKLYAKRIDDAIAAAQVAQVRQESEWRERLAKEVGV